MIKDRFHFTNFGIEPPQERRAFGTDKTIYNPKDKRKNGQEIYLVTKGMVGMRHTFYNGRAIIFDVLRQGDIFGFEDIGLLNPSQQALSLAAHTEIAPYEVNMRSERDQRLIGAAARRREDVQHINWLGLRANNQKVTYLERTAFALDNLAVLDEGGVSVLQTQARIAERGYTHREFACRAIGRLTELQLVEIEATAAIKIKKPGKLRRMITDVYGKIYESQ